MNMLNESFKNLSRFLNQNVQIMLWPVLIKKNSDKSFLDHAELGGEEVLFFLNYIWDELRSSGRLD